MPAVDVFKAGSSALITGAASGIGLAVARLCRSNGMKVLLVDNNADALQSAKSEILAIGGSGADVLTSQTDVSQIESWKSLKRTAISAFGSIELLMLNAGVGARGSWGDGDYFEKVRFRRTNV